MSEPDRPAEEIGTIASQRYEPEFEADSTFALSVIEGPDIGKTFQMDGSEAGPVLVGQSASCTVQVADNRVSRRHLELDVEGRRLRVTDLKSTNGTYVDGVCVLDAYLTGGEIVRLGSTALRIERNAPAETAKRPEDRTGVGAFIGHSPEIRRLYPLVEKLAASEVPIVIEGETGTGKEVLAEAIHEMGPRRDGPYVVLDCTTLSPQLVESELFGHERGSFTGAAGQRRGVFELAHGGTLFIDEIGDLDLAQQPKLLRALERGEIRRVGGNGLITVDVRVISATRRDLDRASQDGTFRDDLFHRLAVGRIALPPLRKRRGDVAILARHFWNTLAPGTPLPAHLLERWEAYEWPGNVRELRNAVAHQLATGDLPDLLGAEPQTDAAEAVLARGEAEIRAILRSRLPLPVARVRLLEKFQKSYVERALAEHPNAEQAATALGIGRRYLHMLKAGPRKR